MKTTMKVYVMPFGERRGELWFDDVFVRLRLLRLRECSSSSFATISVLRGCDIFSYICTPSVVIQLELSLSSTTFSSPTMMGHKLVVI